MAHDADPIHNLVARKRDIYVRFRACRVITQDMTAKGQLRSTPSPKIPARMLQGRVFTRYPRILPTAAIAELIARLTRRLQDVAALPNF